jgi:hypothetical protein
MIRVVAHQDLAKGRLESLDVPLEVVAEFEVELILPALLHRRDRDEAAAFGVEQDAGPKLLVDQDACFFLVDPACHRRRHTLVDYALGAGDLRALFRIERTGPAEHAAHE